jgi:hypothetical protein
MASGLMVARVSAASHTCIAHQATHDVFSHFSPKRQASHIRPWRRVSSRKRIAAFAYTRTHIAPRDTPLQVGASSFSSAPSWTSSRGNGTRRKKASIQTHAQSNSASQKGHERGAEGASRATDTANCVGASNTKEPQTYFLQFNASLRNSFCVVAFTHTSIFRKTSSRCSGAKDL